MKSEIAVTRRTVN